ncbi:MAG: glycogen/starch/alpha-glucan phosphorylase [Deltaproteobacteria bacterium]|nr:glycogen/starch/alpha-glucan phosphorylase [Deltaproteobacteria bacterium]
MLKRIESSLFEQWKTLQKGMDADAVQLSFANHLHYTLAKGVERATTHDIYTALALAARDRMVERWMATQHRCHQVDAKRVYYLSAEYLMGRMLINTLINLGIYDATVEACQRTGTTLGQLAEEEPDPGLGNGGLGRLAACFLDSLTALQIPAYGYGIRYEFGIFAQGIRDNCQVELPDNWLRDGNPWEIPRPERSYTVKFHGRTMQTRDPHRGLKVQWVDADEVVGMAYDTPIDGYNNESVNTLRLWQARASKEFDLAYFHHGDYLRAVEEKNISENISKVLYPNIDVMEGRELRLKQQYFFVSCSLQDILRRYIKHHNGFDALPDKVAIQLNDTHPALAVVELLRLLIDEHDLPWEKAWALTVRTCAYTNHTLLAEALERWSVPLFQRLLPRHLELVYEINRRFLRNVAMRYPGDSERQERMSLIEESQPKRVRMAHLAIVGSHSVNGVSELHTHLLRTRMLRDFDEMFPERFNAKTNGITPRRWLLAANPALAKLVSESIGSKWPGQLQELKKLEPFALDVGFCDRFAGVRQQNKRQLAQLTKELTGIVVDPTSIFDVQVKRIHEYKRQTLNALHVISSWLRLKQNSYPDFHPRTFFFGGKAAPDYFMAKLTIQLICQVAEMVNQDPNTRNLLKVVFLPNYRVSLAERVIPAADVSEQISTAGYEASGTGNMKFTLNGALTVGTLDGANIEIRDEVGDENIFIFGMTADEVVSRRQGYNPRAIYEQNPLLRDTLDLIRSGFFSPEQPAMFHPLVDNLLGEDPYMNLADFDAYVKCQESLNLVYNQSATWWKMAVLNVAASGKFSSDRTIAEYNRDIWHAKPVKVLLPG